MKTHFRKINREPSLSSCFIDSVSSPFLGIITLIIMLPVFLNSCSEAAGDPVSAHVECKSGTGLSLDTSNIGTLDIFVFRDDELQRLDCYQRFDDMGDWNGTVTSGSGRIIITALANSAYGREHWTAMNSRSYLQKDCLRLEDERAESPFMSGEISVNAKGGLSSVKNDLSMMPYTCEIYLNSLSCDFTGKAYAGEEITDIKVYLTNVNAECAIAEEKGSAPRRIINFGGLCPEDIEEFTEPELIAREITRPVGRRKVYPDISLRCYQSCHPEETPGTPYTRLVIEGRVSGQTYYWPININRDGGDGVRRNHRYEYDITIRCKGSTDPDTPVRSEVITIKQKVTEWKEIEEYEVSF